MTKHAHPSNLELQALSVLWDRGPSTVAEVLDFLPDGRERAYTTVLSVMQSLERKKLVKRSGERRGRALIYHAMHPSDRILQHSVNDFIINHFGGSAGAAILTILSTGTLTPEEKSRIECELERHEAMAAKKTVKTATKAATKLPAKKAAKAVKKAVKSAKKSTAKKAAKSVAKTAGTTKATAKKTTKKATAKKTAAKKVAKTIAKKVTRKSATRASGQS